MYLISVSAFEILQEEQIVYAHDSVISEISKGKLEWVTVGSFPTVIFIQPILNEYLQYLQH